MFNIVNSKLLTVNLCFSWKEKVKSEVSQFDQLSVMWMISLLGPNWTILSAVVSRSQNIILLAGLLREYKVSKNALIGLYFFLHKRITHSFHDPTVRPSQCMLSEHLFLTLIKRNCWMDLTTANPSAGWGRPDSDRIMEIMTLKLLSDWREWLILSNIHRVRNY